MDPTKRWDNRSVFTNRATSTITGESTDSSVSLGTHGYASAVRSRKRPLFPDSTVFESANTDQNDGGVGHSCVYIGMARTGTFRYVNAGIVSSKTATAPGNQALLKALGNLTDHDFSESLVEFKSTVGMVVNRINQMRTFANHVRKGNWNALKHSPSRKARSDPGDKRFANNWLELQFGWKPLVSDIYAGVEAYQRGITQRGTTIYKRSSHTVRNGNAVATAKAGVGGIVHNSTIRTLASYGLLNPALILWNRIPLSFVVDWLVPVGRTLGQLNATAGLRHTWGWKTNHTVRVSDLRGQRCARGQIVEGSEIRQTWLRGPYTGFIIFPGSWKSGSAVTAGKIATATALLRQRV